MIWAWNPPTIDCAGATETSTLVYHGWVSNIRIIGRILGADGLPMPVYGLSGPTEEFQTPSTTIEYELPTPALGEAALLSIEASDEPGNESENCI